MLTIRKLAFAGASLVALSTPAFAQDTAAKDGEESAYSDGDIVVEARRRDESAQDVPLVVNAVTADAVAKLNMRDFKDITSVVPGLSMANNANGIGTTSSVRGVNYDVNASGNNGTIEYYLNDAPVSAAVLFTKMYDIGQIEVLRGPQGTLRGRASPSGSITVNARRPDMTEVGAVVQGTINDIGSRNVNAAINVPLVNDILAVRVAGGYDQGEGNRVHSINSTAQPYTDVSFGRVSIRATPVDFLELNGMYQVSTSNATQFDQMASFSLYSAGAPASAVVIRPEDRLSINAAPREMYQRFEVFNWNAAIRLAGQKLVYVGHHSNSLYKSFDPSAGDPTNFFKGQSIGQTTTTHSTQESHEVRLQNEERIAGMFDYVVGYFHNTLVPPSLLDRVTPVGLNFGTFGSLATTAITKIGRTGASQEESYFGNLTVHLGDATEISGGLRHIKYASQADLYISCPNYTDCAPLAAAHEDSKFSHTIYAASIKHRFNDNLMVYANYGTSWRPGLSVVGDFSVNRSALENSFLILPPETSKSFEIGFKSDWMDKRAHLNVSIYQQDFTNFPYRSSSGVYFINYAAAVSNGVVTVTPTPTNFNFVGAVPVRVKGVEVEGSFKVTPNWTIGGNVNYSLGRLRNGLMPCNDLNKDGVPDVLTSAPSLAQLQAAYGANNLGACRLNVRSASAPVWSGVVNTEFNAPVSDKMEGFLRGLWSWQGKTGNDPQNAFDDVHRNSTLNLFLGLRDPDGAWEVSLFGKNVLNDKTVTSVSNGPASTSYQSLPYVLVNGVPTITGRPTGAVFTSTYANITMAAPREFGITARIALGSR